jgi:hypothetical protein
MGYLLWAKAMMRRAQLRLQPLARQIAGDFDGIGLADTDPDGEDDKRLAIW